MEPLRKKVGGLWKSYPIDAMRWAVGGLAANGITSQNNCMDCHGDNVPSVETYNTLNK